jgi:tetratricopeptide (TPR) repeat protein
MEKMARRIPDALVIAVLAFFEGAGLYSQSYTASPSSILVRYSFDDGLLDTGPDTFTVFQNAKGSVRLNNQNRFSGYRSIEIRDIAGDRDFPELQGYFEGRTRGKVFAHFALMMTNPADELNIALAGPQWFALRKDGISFWLRTIDGFLCHYSDSMPKKLFAPVPFIWYVVNVAYDVDAGAYSLVIYREGEPDPVIRLFEQPNASNQAGSAVDKFSFIGDTGTDVSNVVYYVDDVVVGVDESITQLPFAAPGRRKLFVDYWNEYQRTIHGRPGPIPVTEFSDLGIRSAEIQSLQQAGLWELLQEIVTSNRDRTIPPSASPENRRLLQAVGAWRSGSVALSSGRPEVALERFEEAAFLAPGGKVYAMNAALSLAALGRWPEVDNLLARIYADWRDDIRFPVAAAMIGIAREDLPQAERWLRTSVEQEPTSGPMAEWAAAQYFYVLLWQKQFMRAEQFAHQMAQSDQNAIWLERLGDTAFMSEDFAGALRRYEESLVGRDRTNTRVLLKLSDVHFRLGDLDRERHYRELLYGRLGY